MKIIERFKNLFRKENNVSDGYHTFGELYEYRLVYNALWFNSLSKHFNKNGVVNPYNVHKSERHNGGEKCFGGGWFIVMAQLPTGQVSNHYEMKYWNYFDIPIQQRADRWDGHTPQEALERMKGVLITRTI